MKIFKTESMEILLEKVEKFISDNGLDFDDTGSALNSNCTVLAGFICFLLEETTPASAKAPSDSKPVIGRVLSENKTQGINLIEKLTMGSETTQELLRVFDYAFYNSYESFWYTAEAKEKFIF